MLKRLRGLFICEASFWSFCKRWENTSNKTPKINKNSKRNNLSDIIKHCHLCQVINTNLRRYMYKWRNVVNCRKLLGKKYFNLDIDLIKYYFFFFTLLPFTWLSNSDAYFYGKICPFAIAISSNFNLLKYSDF